MSDRPFPHDTTLDGPEEPREPRPERDPDEAMEAHEEAEQIEREFGRDWHPSDTREDW